MKQIFCVLAFASILSCTVNLIANDHWAQLQGNAARSGNAPPGCEDFQMLWGQGNESAIRIFEKIRGTSLTFLCAAFVEHAN